MPRERRDFVRRSGHRDASLVVLACEGAVTEVEYFDGLKVHLHSPRIHVQVLRRNDATLSSPQHVLGMLIDFRQQYQLREGDELWLVADRDPQSWDDEMLSVVASECHQRDFKLALSNPSFELWLLLHLEGAPQDHTEWLANRDRFLKRRFAQHRRPNTADFEVCRPGLDIAVERARRLDTSPSDRWPQGLGTRVYLIVEAIRRRMAA